MKKVIIKSGVLMAVLSNWAFAYNFGFSGYDGYHGQHGMNGRSGDNIAVWANGEIQSFDLSGTDGTNGQNGQMGGHASGCFQPYRPPYNLYGANGGDGGDGGRGGHGGNGGDVKIYFQNLEDLKKIYINSSGGAPGFGGESSYGGEGCKCMISFWSITRCRRDHTDCYSTTYSCFSGYDGRYGARGNHGVSGKDGFLTIIKSDDWLREENPELNISLQRLSTTPVGLSEHIWQYKNGASFLLYPGSVMQNMYKEYLRTQERTVSLLWRDPRPIEDFREMFVTFKMNKGRLSYALPEGLWISGGLVRSGQDVEFKINRAFRKDEMAEFYHSGDKGKGRGIVTTLTDKFDITDPVKTTFKIKVLERLWYGGTKKVFEGLVPENLIDKNQNKYIIGVGLLDFSSRYKEKGVKLRFEIWATHSYKSFKKTKKITTNYKVGDH